MKIYSNEIETTKSVNLLGIEIDNQLSFNQHILKLSSKTAMQLNAKSRLAKFMGNKGKVGMIDSFVNSNFDYCRLVWHFCSCESSQKKRKKSKTLPKISTPRLRSDYGNLIKKNSTATAEIKRLWTLATKVFKTVNNNSSSYMKKKITPKTNGKIR